MTPGPDWDRRTALVNAIRADMDKAMTPPYEVASDPASGGDWTGMVEAERRADGDWRWGTSALMATLAARPAPEPEPTFEERRQRCEAMGLVLCSCTGVDRGGQHVMIISLACPIHGVKRGR